MKLSWEDQARRLVTQNGDIEERRVAYGLRIASVLNRVRVQGQRSEHHKKQEWKRGMESSLEFEIYTKRLPASKER